MRKLLQLAFDFLETTTPAAPQAEPSVPAGVPAPDAAAGAVAAGSPLLRHPRANRDAALDGRVIGYELQRSRRRTIGLSVSHEGLVVRAPRACPLAQIEQALRHKADWIVRKLDEVGARHGRAQASRIVWRDGAELPYLGAPLRLVLAGAPGDGIAPRRPRMPELRESAAGDGAPVRVLRLPLPPGASEEAIRDAAHGWMLHAARLHFLERMAHFAPLLGVQWGHFGLTSARTRWGSASTTGAVRLNWRLMHMRPALVDYVVAHELAHLRVMDHSPRFWAVVATVVPEHRALRRELRETPVPLWEADAPS